MVMRFTNLTLRSLFVFGLELTLIAATLEKPLKNLREQRSRLYSKIRSLDVIKSKISPADQDKVVNIRFMYWPFEVLSLEERSQTVVSSGFTQILWNDTDLSWNVSEYGGIDVLSLKPDEVWHPKILVPNAAHKDYATIEFQWVRLLSTGALDLQAPLFLKTTCNLDLSYYPLDIQKCEIRFMPYFDDIKYNITTMEFSYMPEAFKLTGEWSIEARWFIDDDDLQQKGTENIIRFGVKLKRRRLYYIVCLLAPMAITSSMTSLVFWIPSASREKMTFLVTVFVSNALFLNSIADTIPRNLSAVPRLALFLLITTLQCFLAMVATTIVMRRHHAEQEDTTRSMNFLQEPINYQDLIYTKNVKTPNHQPRTESMELLDASKLHLQNLEESGASSGQNKLDPVAPLKSKFAKASTEKSKCCIRASTLDIVFFVLFHGTSVPAYFVLYECYQHVINS